MFFCNNEYYLFKESLYRLQNKNITENIWNKIDFLQTVNKTPASIYTS